MIYLVSNQKSLFETDLYKELDVKSALEMLNKEEILAADTETEGFDWLTKKILTIQLGNADWQIVWDCTTVPISLLKEILETKTLVFWNYLFDGLFLYHNNIWPRSVVDLMLHEKLLYLGIDYKEILLPNCIRDFGNDYTPWALKTAVKRYCNEELDKTVRGQIIKVGLTPEVIQYSGRDVAFELQVMEAQNILLEEKKLLAAAKFEDEFVKCLTYMKFCGVKLDVESWKNKMDSDQKKLSKYLNELNTWVIDFWNEHKDKDEKYIIYDLKVGKNYNGTYIDISPDLPKEAVLLKGRSEIGYNEEGERIIYNIGTYKIPFGYTQNKKFHPYIYKELQGDLFNGFNTDPQCAINWSSSSQLIPLFSMLGYNLNTIDKETKLPKKSVAAKIIEPQQDISTIGKPYLAYKKAEKVCTTYGQNWLDGLKSDGRIHPDYDQLGTATARLSSGGKSEGSKKLNIQNLPRDSVTRGCFVAEKGNKWLSLDYQSQESRLLASVANDSAMLALYAPGGCGDMHALVAKMAFSHFLKDVPIEKVKSVRPDLRQRAKSVEFCINYGGNADTMHQNDNIPIEEAKEIYNNYMQGFPGVRDYQDYCRKAVMRDGYILENPITGHKAFIHNWDELSAIQEEMKEEGFWQEYRSMKQIDPSSDICFRVRKYYREKSELEKASINYRIQNRGAMSTKLAGTLLFNYILKHNLQNIVKICLQVHDEYNCECPEEMSEEIAVVIRRCMEQGAKPFCTRLPLSADLSRLEDGSIPNCWLHE